MIKSLFSISTTLLLILCFNASLAIAEQSPEKVLTKLLSEIKSAANSSPVVNYVDWQKAFKNLDPEKKSKIAVNSPEEMKSYYQSILSYPLKLMNKQYLEKTKSLNSQQKVIFEENFSNIKKQLEEKIKEMNIRISESEYEVGKAEIKGSTAMVPLSRKYMGKTRQEKVRLEKTGDVWLLPAVNTLASKSQ